jgi:hypothetical protein
MCDDQSNGGVSIGGVVAAVLSSIVCAFLVALWCGHFLFAPRDVEGRRSTWPFNRRRATSKAKTLTVDCSTGAGDPYHTESPKPCKQTFVLAVSVLLEEGRPPVVVPVSTCEHALSRYFSAAVLRCAALSHQVSLGNMRMRVKKGIITSVFNAHKDNNSDASTTMADLGVDLDSSSNSAGLLDVAFVPATSQVVEVVQASAAATEGEATLAGSSLSEEEKGRL